MTYGTISPKYQVVIPKEIREQISVKPGQRLMIIAKDNVIYMVHEASLKDLKGRFKGMSIDNLRDEDDRI
ncbi:AbrB/MazE/SpoVT family DNA-binding domain-containing protein [bacterium]|nr:AbrB/MazE/SpoVT family DNA-binding domain-containing protein [bacterium]